jgi:NAD+ synthase
MKKKLKKIIKNAFNFLFMLTLDALDIDTYKVVEAICEFIRDQVNSTGLNGALISVSGGLDSSVLLSLAVRCLGSRNVFAITMPDRDVTPESDISDVMQITDTLGVTCEVVEITPIIQVIRELLPLDNVSNKVALGNIKARARMVISYNYANVKNLMVLGSSNKTEWLSGYFTKHGDGAVDLMPLADIYKCQIRQIAEYLGIPRSIIMKPPSAGLWQGQTDEEEMGITYDLLDLILYATEIGLSEEEIINNLNISAAIVGGILKRVRANEHKRRLPPILKLNSIV